MPAPGAAILLSDFPCRVLDAPTPAREQGLPPYGAFVFFRRPEGGSERKADSASAGA